MSRHDTLTPTARTLDKVLWQAAPFRWVSTQERRTLRRQLDLVVIDGAEQLYAAGDSLNEVTFVVSGRLASNPPEIVYGEGSSLGVASALQRPAPLLWDVVALERSTIAVFERRRFVASLESLPTFAAALLRELAASALGGGQF